MHSPVMHIGLLLSSLFFCINRNDLCAETVVADATWFYRWT